MDKPKVIILGGGPGLGRARQMMVAIQAAGYDVEYQPLPNVGAIGHKPDLVLFDEFVKMDFSKVEERILGRYNCIPMAKPADRRKGPKGPRGKWGKLK